VFPFSTEEILTQEETIQRVRALRPVHAPRASNSLRARSP
jgi:hypothetical protein